MWLFAVVALALLLSVACRRLSRLSLSDRDLELLRERNSCVPWFLEQRFEERLCTYRHFGFRLMSMLYLPLRQDFKGLCRGSWRGRGLLVAFDGLYRCCGSRASWMGTFVICGWCWGCTCLQHGQLERYRREPLAATATG